MQCPNCQHENKTGRKFCGQCGTKLGWKCADCGFTNHPSDRFCGGCGTKSDETTPPQTETRIPKLENLHAQLQTLIPDTLAQKYLAAEQETTGENRLITALFADISGSTELSATRSPESMFQLIQDCFKDLVDIVANYEGRISGFRGDGLLAFFGAPILHENDAERAILAAIDMRETMRGHGLEITVGINTASMTVGEIRTQLHAEYTAYGTEIVLAKRLQETADRGQIRVGEATYRFTQRAFAFEELSPQSLKGFDRPIRAYSVVRVLEHPEKLRGIEGLQAKLIGREREYIALIDAADALIDERKGQIVTIVGEAGIGKSRLVKELKTYLQGSRAGGSPVSSPRWLEGRCISIGQTVSFWPFIDMMRTYLGVSGEDGEEEIADKLIGQMENLFGQEADGVIPYVGQMLSVKLPKPYQERIQYAAPEQIRHQTLLRMRDVFVALARKQPLIVILEDLHWADDLSLDLLWVLMDELVAAPLMLVCVYRPEREHGSWQIDGIASGKFLERYTPITLRPLTAKQSQQMVESLLAVENLPAETKATILEKTEGNPFFVEEVIRWLIDQGVIYQEGKRWQAKASITELEVPDTIQSVILSRIDRLHEEVKYVLRCASVIGRVFQQRLLGYLSHQEGMLEARLAELETNELIYKEHILPELEYAFKHALTHETTYQGLLGQQQSAFHERVGEGIELLYQGQIGEYYEQLAYHYSRSGNKEKAIEYLVKAAQKAASRYANQEALDYFQRALDLAKSDDESDRILKYRAKLLLNLYQGREAASDYECLLNSAKGRGDQKDELESLLGLASAYYTIALDELDFASKSLALYKQAYTLARKLDNRTCMVRALVPTTWFMDFWPEYRDETLANAEDALILSQEIGDKELIIDSKMAMLDTLRRIPDCIEAAEEQGEELLNQLKSCHDLLRLKEVYFQLMCMHLSRGNFERSVECCDAGINLAAEIGVPPVQFPTFKALALLNLGRYDEAWESLQKEVVDETHRFGSAFKNYGTGIYFLELMAYEKAAEIFESVIEQAKRLGRAWMRSEAQIGLAKSLLRTGQLEQADLDRITQDLASMDVTLPAQILGEFALRARRKLNFRIPNYRRRMNYETSTRNPRRGRYVSATGRTCRESR
ncbi:AAA family ATPase [Candidatus Poribacteria bacterium]|nr:AAA family ATPase [Candidatus Poribacteria bacterium]